eukprot:15365533-Ditylum_brightwellii.AAC.1
MAIGFHADNTCAGGYVHILDVIKGWSCLVHLLKDSNVSIRNVSIAITTLAYDDPEYNDMVISELNQALDLNDVMDHSS